MDVPMFQLILDLIGLTDEVSHHSTIDASWEQAYCLSHQLDFLHSLPWFVGISRQTDPETWALSCGTYLYSFMKSYQCLSVPPCCALERVWALKTSLLVSHWVATTPEPPLFFISYHLLSSSVSPTWDISQINLIVSLYTWRVQQHLSYVVLSISWPFYSIFCLLHMTMIFLRAETLSDATCIIQSFVWNKNLSNTHFLKTLVWHSVRNSLG